MNLIPDDFKHPSGGERVTGAAEDAIRLAHKALDRFPDVVKRHMFIAGGAAISSSLVALAGVAITRRMRSGQTEEEALASITEEELSGRRVELPHADPPDADRPDTDQPDTDQPDADQPDADQPDADRPDADRPNADQPNADLPRSGLPDEQPTNGTGAHGTPVGEHPGIEGASIAESEFDAPIEDPDGAPVASDGVVPAEPRP